MPGETKYFYSNIEQEAQLHVADRSGCHWLSRSFKVDFHVIWKPICDFLSV